MGTFSDFEKNAMLNSLASPVYAKLHLGDPGVAGTLNPATETTRKSCGLAAAAAGVRVSNTAQSWTAYPAAETISWVSFWDAATAGNFLGKDDLPAAKAVGVGDT